MAGTPPLSADHLIDRSRLRRKLSFWRILAALAVIGLIGLIGYRFSGAGNSVAGEHIARVTISGLITGDRETLRLLERVRNSQAKAVVLSISSPGGTVSGSEALYDGLRRLSEKKPVVAVVENMAASGAYVAAIGADRIIARQNSLVGSIGVLVQIPNFSKLLDHVGVNVESIKSSPLKAAPSGLEPTTPEARDAMAAIVMDSYDWFKTLVAERRGLSGADLDVVANGRVFTGRQSLKLKLVDELGDERTAIAWLEKEKGISKDLRVRDWRRSGSSNFGLTSLAALARLAGLETFSQSLNDLHSVAESRMLDGLVAVWHGGLGN